MLFGVAYMDGVVVDSKKTITPIQSGKAAW